ncbi:LCP family protein [Actinophytocola oryzae]|uniref:LytR family transcriptional attenuator n=1 Tax=Actinophytocola oryzae TaxID=502181 RepID=A0A4R7VRP7_9PSEU|nr:LCP family protein [Actinophytocola oryzae]TDV52490.1 LytR family transcriptional attenuator [Actinophytocola oryzae]
MTNDRTEQLIRDAFADEAAHAVDSREVLAAVRGRKPRRSYGLVLAAAAVVVVVAAVATFVVPKVFRESTPAATQQHQQATDAITPTNVLVVGTDANDYTDSIVLVRLAEDGTTSVISLPRDSWVSSAGTMTKLNQVYKNSGIDGLAAAVGDLTGAPVDHWAVVDTTAVADLADAVGGVEVCLRRATSDLYSGADFVAGRQVISGDAALPFVRQRHGLPHGDLDRVVRLQVFLRSALAKVTVRQLPALLDAVGDHVRMDPGLDAIGFLQDVLQGGKLRYATIPVGDVDFQTPESGSAIEVDPAQVRQFVTDLPSTPPASGGLPCVN